MASPSDFLTSIRPVNSLMIGIAVLVGIAVISPTDITSILAGTAFLTGFLISGFAMVINDIYDIEIDRVNDPERPIASGRMSERTALVFALVLLLFGLISSTFLTFSNFLLASIFAVISWGYSFWGKRSGILGNMMVAASMAVPFIFGGVAAGVERGSDDIFLWSLAIMAFLSGTGREVIKAIADVKGDQERNVRSVALVYGNRAASIASGGLLLVAILTSFLPYLIQVAGTVYLLLVLVPDTIFLYVTLRILRDDSPTNAEKVKTLALIGMVMGLVAFVLGGAFRP